MLAVALGNMRDPRVFKVLLNLLGDPQVQGHVIIGLRKLGIAAARPYLEPFLKHEETWIRKEAKRAIAQIDRTSLKRTTKPVSRRVQ
jgi:HEAT repeat protein